MEKSITETFIFDTLIFILATDIGDGLLYNIKKGGDKIS